MRLPDLRHKYGSAYDQIGIKGVNNGLLCLEDNTNIAIYETSSVNFELRSEAEQDALIENYKSFLNSLSFPLQIIIRTREIDLDSIESLISERQRSEDAPVFRSQLENYRAFIKSLVKDNRILTRKFYIAFSYKGDSRSDGSDNAKEQLSIRADILMKGLQRLGMSVIQLDDIAILNLFYSFYNPVSAKNRPLSDELLAAMKPQLTEYKHA